MGSRVTLLLAVLVALSGVSVVGGEVVDSPPTFSLENDADTTHRVTAYTADSRAEALLMNFQVTTENGTQRLVTLSQLVWPEGYRNVTVADQGVPAQHITVEPDEHTTATIDSWNPGEVTVYIVTDMGENKTHVQTKLETCTQRGQEHSLHLEESGSSGSAVCASNLEWMLA